MKIYSNEFIELAQYTVVYCVWHVFRGAWGGGGVGTKREQRYKLPRPGRKRFRDIYATPRILF